MALCRRLFWRHMKNIPPIWAVWRANWSCWQRTLGLVVAVVMSIFLIGFFLGIVYVY